MKNTLILAFLFLCSFCYSQTTYECNAKIGEYGMWNIIDMNIVIYSDQIKLTPLEGVNLSIQYTKQQDGFYYYGEIIRASIFSPNEGEYLITVLGQIYKCKLRS